MTSLEDIKKKFDGIYPGFHFMRHFLALTILAHHTRILLRGQDAAIGEYVKGDILSTVGGAFSIANFSVELLRPLLFALVGSFFALSGFLVADSAVRTKDVRVFLTFRILRIFPALMSEVALSALFLGLLVTTLPISEYFSSPVLLAYFGNIIGNIHYVLPGVFENNPTPNIVNGNLWTLPSEFDCYLIITGLMLTRVLYNPKRFLIVFGIISILVLAAPFFFDIATRSDNTHFSGWFIVYLFLVGVAFSLFSSRVMINKWVCAVMAIVYVLGMLFKVSDFFCGFALVYCTLYFGTLRYTWFDNIIKSDFSYGAYLYGYPIAQTVIFVLLPYGIATIPAPIGFPIVLGLTLVFTFVFATLSWKYIEKPCLNLKQYFLKKKPV